MRDERHLRDPCPSETKKIPSLRHASAHPHQNRKCALKRSMVKLSHVGSALLGWRCLWLAWCGDIVREDFQLDFGSAERLLKSARRARAALC
jgi:hypothetical protein